MSRKIAEELLPRLRQRYANRGREGRTRLIDAVCEQWGYSRKHTTKLLGAKAGWEGHPTRRQGRPPAYGAEVLTVLWRIWKAAEQPCGKRLKALLPTWLPHYEAGYGRLGKTLRQKVLSISAAQIDRRLAARKVRGSHRGRCGTKPGGILKTQIPIRTDNWDVTRPGFLEADTVAHCGGRLEGDFIWSVTYCDLYSGWTCNRAVWNKRRLRASWRHPRSGGGAAFRAARFRYGQRQRVPQLAPVAPLPRTAQTGGFHPLAAL